MLTAGATLGEELVIPINHFSGNYTCDDETLRRLQAEDRIVLRYADNPNGSVDAIAGIANEAGNVVGLMPHPECGQCRVVGLHRRARAVALARRGRLGPRRLLNTAA